ncbi:hypothetical protein AVEN_170913-1 [Araneus ventricosus]|uniref:DUF4371 domain-containing protein n=1 Tax=Araneus ventricosus TaxID=182803 RepID=A0A4Y2U1Q9_ARAVE|nr:hypothetical protein AVEN_112042-1 [Araneus ventricosus]GBO05575.1 hypothetical protein AVEN_170913-1 [Araneus ventricosus]
MSGQHAGVQAFIQCAYKNAQYVHCCVHQPDLIVGQATSQNQQVRVFFSNLSDITNFFNKSPQRIAILDETVRKRIPHGSATRWNFKSRTSNTVYEYGEQLIECMRKIESTSKQAVAINQARSYSLYVRRIEICVLAYSVSQYYATCQCVIQPASENTN